jgi:hypothetical protein
MKHSLILLSFCIASVFSFSQKSSTVTFNTDMSEDYFFNPLEDTLYISGSFPDHEWMMPGTDPLMVLSDPDEDLIYSLQMELPIGVYAYKYYMAAGWDCGEWDGDPNREFTVSEDGQSVVLNDVIGMNCFYTVTFTISSDELPIENAAVDVERFETRYTDPYGSTYYYPSYNGCNVEYTVSAEGYYTESGIFDTYGCDQDIEIDLSMIRTSICCLQNRPYSIVIINDRLYIDSKYEYSLIIYNTLGQPVCQRTVSKGMNVISTIAFKQGIYLLLLIHENVSNFTKIVLP